jgi:leucyl aminopeptidase
MPNRLPLGSLLTPVHEIRAGVSATKLQRHAGALLLLPPQPAPADWAALPQHDELRALFETRGRKAGDFFSLRVGARAQTLLVVAVAGDEASAFQGLQAAGRWARALLEAEPATLLIWQQGLAAEAAAAALLAAVCALQAGAFQFASFKSKPKPPRRLRSIEIAARGRLRGLDVALATSAGNNLARWLTALPPSELDASGYRRHLRQFARTLGLGFQFYGERQLKRLGAGAFLAVARANPERDAGIVRLTYRPRGAATPDLALVGKGICFDTGGTNLKPHKSMVDMHTDMEGSAVALGSLFALQALESPLAIDCWLAITENRIGSTAYKPQDIVTAVNGTTIQVIHTDAEGRMVLADALCLASARRPKAIIDYATLTGACVYALTERYSGAFTNRIDTRDLIEAAGRSSGERVWCFPMDADYDTDLESSIADIMQCAVDGKGDHILAARFLSRFVPAQIPWLHIDLASGTRHGGLAHIGTEITGFGVRFTVDLVGRGWPRAPRRT